MRPTVNAGLLPFSFLSFGTAGVPTHIGGAASAPECALSIIKCLKQSVCVCVCVCVCVSATPPEWGLSITKTKEQVALHGMSVTTAKASVRIPEDGVQTQTLPSHPIPSHSMPATAPLRQLHFSSPCESFLPGGFVSWMFCSVQSLRSSQI